MHGPPLISVIINNYNYAGFLDQAIRSALDQHGPTFEVIVVDDGSTDGSREVIAQFGPQVRAVLQENAGQAAAINAGVRHSQGRFLCFLDADDWCAPGKLAAITHAFYDNPKAGLVFHRLQPRLNDGRDAFKPIPTSLCTGDLAPLLARTGGRWPFPLTSAIAIRRSLWDRVGEIPASFRISADAWLVGIYPFLAPVVGLPQVLGFYRIHQNTWYRAEDDAAMLRKRSAHWHETVCLTNTFLRDLGAPWRINLRDHHAYQLAQARLHGASQAGRARLFLDGLRDAAEPNLARRLRDAVRAWRQVSAKGMSPPMSLTTS